MSSLRSETITVTLDGDERDLPCRGWVSVEPGLGMGGGFGAELDGEAQVRLPEGWFDVSDLALDATDPAHIAEVLCGLALEDDGGLDADEYAAAE